MRRTALVLLVAVLVLAGCGGGGKKTSTESTTTRGANGTTGGAAAGAFTSTRCAAAARALASAATAIPQAISGQSKNLDQSVDDLKAFANAAPRDIRADLQTVAEGYAAYAKVLVDAHFDPSSGKPPSQEVINKLQEESQKLNQAEFRDAATRVNTWFQTQCGR